MHGIWAGIHIGKIKASAEHQCKTVIANELWLYARKVERGVSSLKESQGLCGVHPSQLRAVVQLLREQAAVCRAVELARDLSPFP